MSSVSQITGQLLLARARAIRTQFPYSNYDHRPLLPNMDPGDIALSEEFRVTYACFKREVALALNPQIILEIGVGIGISALAFMDACPNAMYRGIDNDFDHGRKFSVKPSQFVSSQMQSKGYMHSITTSDSQALTTFPPADLVHIDGCHGYAETTHDVTLAWDSGAPWILVDDCRDSTVAAATLEVIRFNRQGSVEWAYFEDTYTGSILISRELGRP